MDNKMDLQYDEQRANAISKEQEQVKELLRRGTVRHYFLGPESIWTQEGFGFVMGGFFASFLGGVLLPKLFLYANTNAALKYLCWIITAAGIILLVRGGLGMLKESRKIQEPVPDSIHDEILEYDIANLRNISKILLKTNISKLKDENMDEMEMILVKGPRDYVENVNLPLVWKRGDDGVLRYSNFSVLALYFSKENLYIYTSIFNMRNGTSKFQHTYYCPYNKIKYVGLEDRVIESVNQKNKAFMSNLKMMVINAGDGEEDELSLAVMDYDMVKKMNATMDIQVAEEAVEMIRNRMK